MERVLIVNADDFGLSKGQNYGIVEAYRNGVFSNYAGGERNGRQGSIGKSHARNRTSGAKIG